MEMNEVLELSIVDIIVVPGVSVLILEPNTTSIEITNNDGNTLCKIYMYIYKTFHFVVRQKHMSAYHLINIQSLKEIILC